MKISEMLRTEKNRYSVVIRKLNTKLDLSQLEAVFKKELTNVIEEIELSDEERKSLISEDIIADNRLVKRINETELTENWLLGLGEIETLERVRFRGREFLYPRSQTTYFGIYKRNPLYFCILIRKEVGELLMRAIQVKLEKMGIAFCDCEIKRNEFGQIIQNLQARLSSIGIKLTTPLDQIILKAESGQDILGQNTQQAAGRVTQILNWGTWHDMVLEIPDALVNSDRKFRIRLTDEAEITFYGSLPLSAIEIIIHTVTSFVSCICSQNLLAFVPPTNLEPQESP